MNPTNYVNLTARTDGDDKFYQAIAENYTADKARLNHYALGIAGEAGELVDAIKKHVQYGRELDEVNVREEISDLLWFIARLCEMKSWTFEELMTKNINKLKARYPQGFEQEKEQNRNYDNELEGM